MFNKHKTFSLWAVFTFQLGSKEIKKIAPLRGKGAKKKKKKKEKDQFKVRSS